MRDGGRQQALTGLERGLRADDPNFVRAFEASATTRRPRFSARWPYVVAAIDVLGFGFVLLVDRHPGAAALSVVVAVVVAVVGLCRCRPAWLPRARDRAASRPPRDMLAPSDHWVA